MNITYGYHFQKSVLKSSCVLMNLKEKHIQQSKFNPLSALLMYPGKSCIWCTLCALLTYPGTSWPLSRINLLIKHVKHLDLNWLQVILVYNSSLSCPSESREDDSSPLSAPYCQCIYDATSFKNRLMRAEPFITYGVISVYHCWITMCLD